MEIVSLILLLIEPELSAKFVTLTFLSFILLWILFVNVMYFKNILLKNYDSGVMGFIVRFIGYPLGWGATIYDAIWNVTLGSIVFGQLPPKLSDYDPTRSEPREFTLTERMQLIKAYEPRHTWKWQLANFICTYLVNPFDWGHCEFDK